MAIPAFSLPLGVTCLIDKYVDINIIVACQRQPKFHSKQLSLSVTRACAFICNAPRVCSRGILMALNQPSPPSIGSVASVLGADRTTLTAALKPVQRRGLVTVGIDANDRRSRRLNLTRAG